MWANLGDDMGAFEGLMNLEIPVSQQTLNAVTGLDRFRG